MFRLILSLAVAALIALPLATSPAAAQGRARCDQDDPAGLTIEFGIQVGKFDRKQQEALWKMELRQHGINARTVKRTRDGCLEVYLQEADGSFNTRYYDEDTLELVQE
jgi:hypothetical protein